MPNLRPVVTPIDAVVMLNQSIAVSTLFSVTDPDGDEITQYRFTDTTASGSSGYFVFQGQIQQNGAQLLIDADDLDELFYVGGPVVGNEFIRVQAFDGELFSDPVVARAYTARPESTQPIANVNDISVLGNESVFASSFISAFDPDGFPIVGYSIRDTDIDKSFFSLDGEALEQGVFHNFSVDEFERLRYNAVGRQDENIEVRAFDGTVSSSIGRGNVNARANLNRPVVNFAEDTTVQNELLSLAPLIATSDADGSTIKTIELRDRNGKDFSGFLFFQGEQLDARVWHSFTPDQIDQVFFVGGERNIEEQVRIFVTDGRFRSTRNTISLTNVATGTGAGSEAGIPVLTIDNLVNNVDEQLERLNIADLVTQTDGGIAITDYQVLDANLDSNSSRFVLDGNFLAAGVVHNLTNEEFERMEIRTGLFDDRRMDEMLIRGTNGTFFSDWSRLNVYTEPEYISAFDIVGNWAGPAFAVLRNEQNQIELTYSFMQQIPDYDVGLAVDNPFRDPNPRFFLQFTEAQKVATRTMLAQIESFANVKFIEVPDSPPTVDPVSLNRGGTYRFGNYYRALAEQFGGEPGQDDHPPFCSSTAAPSFNPESGDIWFNVDLSPAGLPISSCFPLDFFFAPDVGPGTLEYESLLDIFAFSMGAGDPSDIFGPPDPQFPILPEATDTDSHTVQYNVADDLSVITGFQLYDVNFFQSAYGPNLNHNTGDDVYSPQTLHLGGDTREAIWDAGGVDTLSAVGSTIDNPIIDLRAGNFSAIGNIAADPLFGFDGNISIAFGVEIENAIGSNNDDMIFGNELDNVITGGDGNDTIRGFGGNDILTGGTGGDRFIFTVADGDNIINEQQLAGRDTIQFEPFPTLDDFTEDFQFRLEGRDLVISLTLDESQTADTTVRIIDQTRGAYRIETLQFGTTLVDLDNLTNQATGANQQFELTPESTIFGNLVAPV